MCVSRGVTVERGRSFSSGPAMSLRCNSAKAATPTITVYTVGTTKPCIWLGRSGEESEQGALDDGVPELVALYPCRSALSACFAAVLEDRKQRESGRTRRPMADCEGAIKGQKRPSQGAFLPARRGSYYRPRLASPYPFLNRRQKLRYSWAVDLDATSGDGRTS